MNIIHPLDDALRARLLKLREDGLKKGMFAGFPHLHEYYSVKRGSTTYVVAPPAVGKTAFIYEVCMNLAEYENCKIAIFTPETGSPVDVYNELLWCKLREPFLKHGSGSVSDKEAKKAMDWISTRFFVIDPLHADLNEHLYFQALQDLEKELDIKIDVAVIDPITDMTIDGVARDLALGQFLTRVRKFSSQYDIHTIVAFHTKAMAMVEGDDVNGNKKRYYPPPTMSDVAGGEMASRKGMYIIGLWRPPIGVIDKETGNVYPSNETRVEILKVKPKAIGKRGIVKLYYNAYSSRFYWMNEKDEIEYSSPNNEEF